MSENPFFPTRYERDQRPLIWVSPLTRELMREQGAFYIAGSRGSGKTSILKSLDAEEQLINETLASQVPQKLVEFIGVYFRATDLFTQSTEGFDWKSFAPNSPDPSLIESAYIGALVELTSVRILMDNLVLLRRRQKIKFTREAVSAVYEKLRIDQPVLFASVRTLDEDPLVTLSLAISRTIQNINAALIRGDREEFLICTRFGQQGHILQKIAPVLLNLVGPPLFRRSPVRLKICIDECDYLVPSQQRILNSLVRISKSPIEWVIAYVDTEYDSLTTTFPRQNLTDADRKVIPLDETSQNRAGEFRLRCQAIASYRLFYALSPERQAQIRLSNPVRTDQFFELNKRLPNTDINVLLHSVLQPRSHISMKVRAFMERAKTFRERAVTIIRESGADGAEEVSKTLGPHMYPYYQTFIFDKFGMRLEDYFGKLTRDPQWSAALRRKEVAAMLMLLDDLRIKEIPFGGASLLLTLADGCIRDFLEIMAAVYDQWRLTKSSSAGPAEFLLSAETLPLEVQRKGIEESSLVKFRGIEEARSLRDDMTSPDTAQMFSRIISGLGKLTRELQVSGDGRASLRTPERGIFTVDREALSILERSVNVDVGSTLRILRRLESENLIVATPERLGASQIQKGQAVYRFRLHKRFSPMFGFSYRGALVEQRMPETVLVDLIFSGGKYAEDGWVRQALERMASTAKQADLFESE